MLSMLKMQIMECEDIMDNPELDDWNSLMFYSLIECFNIIAEIVKYDKSLPYFNLKDNWKLIKKHKFDYALINVQDWYDLVNK